MVTLTKKLFSQSSTPAGFTIFNGKIEPIQGLWDPLIKRGGGNGPMKPRQPGTQPGAKSVRMKSER